MKSWLLNMVVVILLLSESQVLANVASNRSFFKAASSLKTLSGQSSKLNHLQSENRVVFFWASWCVSCSGILRKLDRLGNGGARSRIVSISVDETSKDALEYLRKRRMKRWIGGTLLDSSAVVAESAGFDSVPAVVLVDGKGRIVRSIAGTPDDSAWIQIERHLR